MTSKFPSIDVEALRRRADGVARSGSPDNAAPAPRRGRAGRFGRARPAPVSPPPAPRTASMPPSPLIDAPPAPRKAAGYGRTILVSLAIVAAALMADGFVTSNTLAWVPAAGEASVQIALN
ncbi:hypothetical protein [Wenxinia saemankumensis]|uniref:Uncharacterized protein n=1 Tax=Wenxinia saemankumensis TaxID=1447782 RepID=A0A1M6FS35_9RHOB|nr:hypothetical protein [Wenxinia saemankumensis]SHJ00429.1 hypothetical protein SAMN05444417_2468 [Wenxinia saemankumensis]